MRSFLMMTVGTAAMAATACGGSASGDSGSASAEQETMSVGERKSKAEKKVEFVAHASDQMAASKKFLKTKAALDGVKKTKSGLLYEVLEEGPETGVTPVSTDLVVVHYVGTLKDGVEFDSSRARGAAATFRLNQVIPGWTEGIQLMSEGDRYRFFIPPELAYGEGGRPGSPIGSNEALIFDVELIKVQNPEKNLAKANEFLAENAKKEGVKQTASGLQYEVITEGKADGANPAATDQVTVHYQGTLLNGTEFDSSYRRGAPATFQLNRVIPGWTEGVQLMSEGDKYRFFIPPALAYGEGGGGPIGPNEALVFEVELIEVK